MTVYVDTSAAAKLLVSEAESLDLTEFLDALEDDEVPHSSALLETELRRLAQRLDLQQSNVTDLLDRLALVEPNRSLFHEAGLLPGPSLRSLDALHLATAVRLEARVLVTYDRRLLEASEGIGLDTVTPGREGAR